MRPDTGGPAFPISREQSANGISASSGMTLRDYFAARAMQGFMSQAGALDGSWFVDAEGAYAVADAMLEARSQEVTS